MQRQLRTQSQARCSTAEKMVNLLTDVFTTGSLWLPVAHGEISEKNEMRQNTPLLHILMNRSDTEPRDDAAKFELESLLDSPLCFYTVWNSIP